jgi:L-lysine exporter family protein LysE/ArgO
MSLLSSFVSGALLAGGLIAAIGPQNLHVLRSGLQRHHTAAVVVLCVAADALLIALSVAGASQALQASPASQQALTWLAVPLLVWMAAASARDALAARGIADVDGQRAAPALRDQLLRTAGVTFGNPMVWIETLWIVGAAAAAEDGTGRRWSFALGACTASAAWFGALGFGAGAMSRWLRRPGVLRALSALSATLLLAAAWHLASDDAAKGAAGPPPDRAGPQFEAQAGTRDEAPEAPAAATASARA